MDFEKIYFESLLSNFKNKNNNKKFINSLKDEEISEDSKTIGGGSIPLSAEGNMESTFGYHKNWDLPGAKRDSFKQSKEVYRNLKKYENNIQELSWYLIKNWAYWGGGSAFNKKKPEEELQKNWEEYHNKEKLGFTIDELIGFLKPYLNKDKVHLFRAIAVTNMKNINLRNMGYCWSDIQGMKEYALNADLKTTNNDNIFVLEIETSKDNIDWYSTCEVNMETFEREFRLFLPDNLNCKILSIKNIKEYK